MAEPFKNLISKAVIVGMASHFKKHHASFDEQAFIADASDGLEQLELKARTDRITDIMIQYLPDDFEVSGKILLASLAPPAEDEMSSAAEVDSRGIAGWAIMSLTHYVALQGKAHFELSMSLFKEMTKCFTSEFSIRFFLISDTERTLAVFKTWALDENHHVRRLVSEGSRTRLPWGMRLPVFIEDPYPVIELLELLKDDESEYVRRSVANNLNDIAKDHPDLVADIAEKWMVNASKERAKLIRHACRTLIKNGHAKTLGVLGYNPPSIESVQLEVITPQVTFGEALEFSLTLGSSSGQVQPLMIDFIIHHQKANGTTSPKVFKWRTADLLVNKPLYISKKHPMKKITTRVYYPGLHTLEVMVNGVSVAKSDFQLVM